MSEAKKGGAMDLSDLIERNAAFTPDKTALRFAGARLTMRTLPRASLRQRAR